MRTLGVETNPWTGDELATLMRLRLEGLSAGQIASNIPGKSRNAVIGKMNRLGLKSLSGHINGHGKPKPEPEKKVRVKKEDPKPKPIYQAPVRLDFEAIAPLKEEVFLALPGSTPVRIEHHSDGCRWPIGEGPFLFCNEPVDGKGSYCAAHDAISYRPTPMLNLKGRKS